MSTQNTPTLKERVKKASGLLTLPTECEQSKEDFLMSVVNGLGIHEDDEISLRILLSDDFTFDDLGIGIEHACGKFPGSVSMPRKRAIYNTLVKGVSPEEEAYVEQNTWAPASDATPQMMQTIVSAMKTIGQWKDLELLEAYGPECEASIIDEINKRVKNRCFIIFDDESSNIINVEESHKLMKKARRQSTPKMFLVAGKQKKLYAAGEFPSHVEIECPLHPGILLFDWYCDTCNQTFEGIDYKALQFIRVVRNLGEAPQRGREIKVMLATAREDGLDGLKEDYPECVLNFEELDETDNLPSLKKRTSGGSSDPLNINPEPVDLSSTKRHF